MSGPVAVGTALFFREEFQKVATTKSAPTAQVMRAEIMVRLLDELIARREKDAEVRGV